MKIINAPVGYTCYSTNDEKLYALDANNMNLFRIEYSMHKEGILAEKEVECYTMDFDQKTNTYNFNPEKKGMISMSLLSPIVVKRINK